MSNLIKKPQELNLQAKLKILLYGQAGVGKSTLSLSAPKPLLIDCDGGIHRVNFGHVKDTVQVESYDDVLNLLKEDLRPYESIIIDTGGKLLDFMGEWIISRNSKMGKSNGMLTLQGYGERKAEFSNFCKKISLLNKHLIFVAHRQTQQEGDEFRYVPLFGGSNYDALVTELDLVGYMEAQGKKRTITFDPTSRNDGKNTCNLPSIVEV
ncbi:MAG TPA: DNA-binding protein, partial [Clostridiales bacterium]|nr:DNA-binding protein [Clostridiales bacterium]